MSIEVPFYPVKHQDYSKNQLCGLCFQPLADEGEVVAHERGMSNQRFIDIHKQNKGYKKSRDIFHKECLVEKIKSEVMSSPDDVAKCPSCLDPVNLKSLNLSIKRPETLTIARISNALISKVRKISNSVLVGINSFTSKTSDFIYKKAIEETTILKCFKVFLAVTFSWLAMFQVTSVEEAIGRESIALLSMLITKTLVDFVASKVNKISGPILILVSESLGIIGAASLFLYKHQGPLFSMFKAVDVKLDNTLIRDLGIFIGLVQAYSSDFIIKLIDFKLPAAHRTCVKKA